MTSYRTIFHALLAVAAALPLQAQQRLPDAAPYVEALPAMGRPIDIAATTARRQRLMERLGDAVVVIPANGMRDIGEYAQDNDFRQHNTFFYFTMLESPGAWIVLNARRGGPSEALLLLPDRNAAQERWTGPKLGPGAEAERLTGYPSVLSTTRLDSVLAAAQARGVPIYAPLDATTRGNPVIERLRADSARAPLRNLRPPVDSMRVVKDAVEVAALRRAITITTNGHVELMRNARGGMFEYELEAIIEGAFRRQGADRVGFPTIVGSGPNSTVLHYDVNRRRTRDGDLVVVDAGAEWGQYTADVTRTIPVSGRFTPRQRAIYDLVLGSQQAAMDSVRPGVTIARLTQIAREYMRANSGSLCAPQTCDAYFIHGLSHHIGMDVHDVGPRGALAAGMVFTIEPGIYIPDEALGVRIEDCVLVTATGYELLSGGAPRRADDIERLMAEGRRAQPRGGR